jgi:hypothetical protein
MLPVAGRRRRLAGLGLVLLLQDHHARSQGPHE